MINNELLAYNVYRFEHDFSGFVQYVVASSRKEAIDYYEVELNPGLREYKQEWDCLDDFEYGVRKVTEKQLEKIRIPEPVGGLWSYPLNELIEKELASKEHSMPYVAAVEN